MYDVYFTIEDIRILKGSFLTEGEAKSFVDTMTKRKFYKQYYLIEGRK